MVPLINKCISFFRVLNFIFLVDIYEYRKNEHRDNIKVNMLTDSLKLEIGCNHSSVPDAHVMSIHILIFYDMTSQNPKILFSFDIFLTNAYIKFLFFEVIQSNLKIFSNRTIFFRFHAATALIPVCTLIPVR